MLGSTAIEPKVRLAPRPPSTDELSVRPVTRPGRMAQGRGSGHGPSRAILTWPSDHEAMISAVVGIAVLAGIVLGCLRALVHRRAETSQKKTPAVSPKAASADSS